MVKAWMLIVRPTNCIEAEWPFLFKEHWERIPELIQFEELCHSYSPKRGGPKIGEDSCVPSVSTFLLVRKGIFVRKMEMSLSKHMIFIHDIN